jgi:hypothetical protein
MVIEIDGVTVGVGEGDAPNDLLGDGVILIVGVTVGVTDIVGVTLGVFETLGVILGVGGGDGNTGNPGMKLLIYYKAYINKGI